MDAKRLSVAAAEDRSFAGDFAGAAARVREACDEDPADAELWFLLGYYLARGGDLDGAARALGEALSIDPDHGMAHHLLANCWRDMHRLELAISHYRRALDVLEDEADAIADFGLCQLRAGELDLASALFRRAVAIDEGCELAVRGLDAVGGMAASAPAAQGEEIGQVEWTLPVSPEIVPVAGPAPYPSSESPPEPMAEPLPVPMAEPLPDPRMEALPEPMTEAHSYPLPESPPDPPVPAPRPVPRLDRRLRGPAARMAGAAASQPEPPVPASVPPPFAPELPVAESPAPENAEEEAPTVRTTSITALILSPDVDWAAVAAEAEAAVAANPEDFEGSLRLGGALVRMREFERAVPILERVMARTEGRGAWNGVHSEALALLAEVLLEKKDSLAAYRVGQTMQRLYPNLPRTLYLSGRISQLCGDPRQALRSLKEAARLDPEGPVGRVALEAITEMGG